MAESILPSGEVSFSVSVRIRGHFVQIYTGSLSPRQNHLRDLADRLSGNAYLFLTSSFDVRYSKIIKVSNRM